MIPQVGREVKDPCSDAIHPKVVTLLKDAASAANYQLQVLSKSYYMMNT
jgi:hypothetical protein